MSDEISRDSAIQAGSLPRGVLNRLVRSLKKTHVDSAGESLSTFEPEEDERLHIGIPVTVGPTARKRMLSALAHTGLFGEGADAYTNVLRRCRFVYEPLAIASTLQLVDSQTVLIFDYGGGSLDLALLDITFDEAGMAVSERALGGVRHAGDRLDELLRKALLQRDPKLRRAYEVELGSGSAYDRWRAASYFGVAKIELSRSSGATLRLPGFSRDIHRAEFERAIDPALGEVMSAVSDCLQRGGVAARDVGQVVLTGGSSLIPVVQDRLHKAFEHLTEASFIAGRPGDAASEREALTGVSRGLANYGFVSQFFEATAPCDFGLWSSRGLVTCLKRGEPAVYDVGKASPSRIRIGAGRTGSFALYSNLVRDAFCGALADIAIPPGVEAVDIRIAASRRRFVPAFAIYVAGTKKKLGEFDLEALPAERLERFIESDKEWLPEGDHLVSAFLTRPLQSGDFVEWRTNGLHSRGKVLAIRDVNENSHVERMRDFDPRRYRVDVAIEETGGILNLSRRAQCDWKMGDVRLV